jgi:hypothetical protein
MKSMKRRWFLAPLLVGALAVGLVGGGSILAQIERPLDGLPGFGPWQHDEQHERPLDGGNTYAHGPDHKRLLDGGNTYAHGQDHERPSDGAAWPHGEQH